jgi:FAD/FMN-containing dehydrogenase
VIEIWPGDAEFDDARAIFAGGFDFRPAVIVRPADANEVAQAIALAHERGLELAVRSGGHSAAGFGTTDGGVVLDLGNLNAVAVDTDAQTVWAETGMRARDLAGALGSHGSVVPLGDSGVVGIGGLTLGGGVGYLSRKYGLTIDHLLAADVVTADGELLTATVNDHSDLFWAIRGGGGNFGVVTRLQFGLIDLPSVVGGVLIFPASAQAVNALMDVVQAAPDQLTAVVTVGVLRVPAIPEEWHGRPVIMVQLCCASAADDEAAIKAIRAVGTPLVDTVRAMSFAEIYPPPPSVKLHPKSVGRTMFLSHVDRAAADTIMNYIEESDAMSRGVQIRVLGGAVSQVSDDATAYAHRTKSVIASVSSSYLPLDDKQMRKAWADEFTAALDQGVAGAYVNLMGEEGPDGVRAAYPGSTWDRLAAIKARYDPENVFRRNHNIPPQVTESG